MAIRQLDNLVTTGDLQREDPTQEEVDGLLTSGTNRLKDAKNGTLSLESRFDLAYNAAHSFALAGLRWHGYRPKNRYMVFQTLVHTTKIENEKKRVLDLAHNKRNRTEYDGDFDVDVALVDAVIRVAQDVEAAVRALGAVK